MQGKAKKKMWKKWSILAQSSQSWVFLSTEKFSVLLLPQTSVCRCSSVLTTMQKDGKRCFVGRFLLRQRWIQTRAVTVQHFPLCADGLQRCMFRVCSSAAAPTLTLLLHWCFWGGLGEDRLMGDVFLFHGARGGRNRVVWSWGCTGWGFSGASQELETFSVYIRDAAQALKSPLKPTFSACPHWLFWFYELTFYTDRVLQVENICIFTQVMYL